MYFAVILVKSKKLLVLPKNWVNVKEMGTMVKKSTNLYSVFHSKNAGAAPDFKNGQIRENFDGSTPIIPLTYCTFSVSSLNQNCVIFLSKF